MSPAKQRSSKARSSSHISLLSSASMNNTPAVDIRISSASSPYAHSKSPNVSARLKGTDNPGYLRSSQTSKLSELQLSLPRLCLRRPQDVIKVKKRRGIASEPRHPVKEGLQNEILIRRNQTFQNDNTAEGASSLDEKRRLAEGEYYEQLSDSGKPRRRSMVRTVSKEDYLLGRGANPRTGIVTPGPNNLENVSDHAHSLMKQGAVLPQQWKQSGDQWVCVDAGYDTAASDSHAKPEHNAVNLKLQMPPAVDDQKSQTSQIHMAVPNLVKRHNDSAMTTNSSTMPITQETALSANSLEVPTQYAPRKHLNLSQQVNLPFKRKPVPDTTMPLAQPMIRSQQHILDRNHDKLQFPGAQFRSSSAPVLRRMGDGILRNVHSPTDPIISDIQPILPDAGLFLDDRVGSIERQKGMFYQSPVKTFPDVDKELPCLPTNFGQFPLRQSPQNSETGLISNIPGNQNRSRWEMQKPLGPKAEDPDYLYPRSRRSRTANQDDLKAGRESKWQRDGSSIAVVPTYDNPPREPLLPITGGRMERTWPIPSTAPAPARRPTNTEIHHDPFTTTSMNMNMNTSTPTRQELGPRMVQSRSQPNIVLTTQRAPLPQMSGLRTTAMTRALHTDSEMFLSSPVPRQRLRGMHRPIMPRRVAEPYHIPRTGPMSDIQNTIRMDNQQQSKTTGMHLLQARQGHTAEQNQQNWETDRGIKEGTINHELTDKSGMINEQIMSTHLGQENATNVGLTRKCSRCHDGFVKDKVHNTDGYMDKRRLGSMPSPSNETKPAVTFDGATLVAKSLIQDTKRASGELKHNDDLHNGVSTAGNDDRDHSICCTECCKMDCHEGCLGHPTPQASPKCKDRSIVRESHDPVSISTPALPSNQPPVLKPRSARLGKSPTRNKKLTSMSRDLCDRSDAVSSKQAISPSIFWGGYDKKEHSIGAAAAAQKAIGLSATKKKLGTDVNINSSVSANSASQSAESAPEKMLPIPKAHMPPSSPGSHKITDVTHADQALVGRRKVTPLTNWVIASAIKSRNISGSSIETICIPSVSCLSFGVAWELFSIPFGVARMWLRNNPQLVQYSWLMLEHCWHMICAIRITAQRVFTVVYVYSKTGRWKHAKGVTTTELVRDCLRSGMYLLCFAVMAIVLNRMLRVLFLPLRLILFTGQTFTAVTRKCLTTIW